MKPPPRTRRKPQRILEPEPPPEPSHNPTSKWGKQEQKTLLNGLKKLAKTAGEHGEIDYTYLKKHLRFRTVEEIEAVVEALKTKVISSVSQKVKKSRREQKRSRKPIQVWTDMALAVTGTLEETITKAFSQMLKVSSTEPCTLRNCDPPQIHWPPSDPTKPVGRSAALRPMPRAPGQGQFTAINPAHPLLFIKTPAKRKKPTSNVPPSPFQGQLLIPAGASPATLNQPGQSTAINPAHPVLFIRTPEPTLGPARRPPTLSGQIRVPISKIPPSQKQLLIPVGASPAPPHRPGRAKIPAAPRIAPRPATPASAPTTPSTVPAAVVETPSVSVIQATNQQPSTSAVKPTPLSPHMPASSPGNRITPAPKAAPSSAPSSAPPISKAAAPHTKFGRISKYATKDTPRNFGVQCIVDFEKIYCYLSQIHKPNDDCCLTPMESAIVLDLLMSLQEELPLLDCKKLQKHLVQMYQTLSSPADSPGETAPSTQSEGESAPDSAGTDGQQSSDTPGSSKSVHSGEGQQQPGAENQSSKSNNTSSRAGKGAVPESCPPLNPFMVPTKLLMRK